MAKELLFKSLGSSSVSIGTGLPDAPRNGKDFGGLMITLHPGRNQKMDTPSHRLEAVKTRLQELTRGLNAPLATIRVISEISHGLSAREKAVLQEALGKLEEVEKEVRALKRL